MSFPILVNLRVTSWKLPLAAVNFPHSLPTQSAWAPWERELSQMGHTSATAHPLLWTQYSCCFSLSANVSVSKRELGAGCAASSPHLFQFPLNNVIVEVQTFSLSENSPPVILYVFVLFEITKRSLKGR